MSQRCYASSEDVSMDSTLDSSAEVVQEEPRNKGESRQDQESDVSSGEANDQSSLVQVTPAGLGRSNLQPQQHAALFSLSLIWARCIKQAAQTLNADLSLEDHLPEDHSVVLELAEHLFEETKKEFLRTGILSKEFANRSFADLQLDRLYLSPFDDFLSNMAAVKLNEEISIPGHVLRAIDAPSLLTSTAESSVSFDHLTALIPQESRAQMDEKIDPKVFELIYSKGQLIEESYKGRYEQRRRLGKGGCGEVHETFDIFDQAAYAVKKVVVKAKKLERLLSSGQTLQKEMNEIFALAKLDHRHVVRYYHSWVEFRKRGEDDNDLDGSNSEFDDDETDTSSYTESDMTSSMEDSDVSALGKQLERTTMPRDDVKVDIILFIKMTAYPMTLKDIVETDDSKCKSSKYKHCFHLKPTIRILLAIISGLTYIHREGIIHRDLKPDNVFLSIPRPNQIAGYGDIDISDCSDCEGTRASAYVCPHIGDFGLIHDFKAARPSLSSEHDNMIGTSVYIPPNMKGVPLCNKRDVYSLGAIALELVCRFDSRSERAHVFGALRDKGRFPPEVENGGLADVIKGMMEVEVADRWDLGRVKTWLEKKLEDYIKHGECA